MYKNKSNHKRKLHIFNIDNLQQFIEIPLKINGNTIYQDCLNNVHIITNDSIYQFEINLLDSTIFYYPAFSAKKLKNTLAKCVGYINGNFIFKSVLLHNQKIEYWYKSKPETKKHLN